MADGDFLSPSATAVYAKIKKLKKKRFPLSHKEFSNYQ
jgi:hypothetical protein